MFNVLTSLVLVTALAGAGVGVAGIVASSTDRTDCPGKIVCPLTGELVCKDRCPAAQDANRADCPGKIECPLTGDLVCKDRCPLGDKQTATLPECCRETK